jgi:hypothetical protein
MAATPPGTTPRPPRRRDAAVDEPALVRLARHMLGQITTLVAEVERLRTENQALGAEVRDATIMLERVGRALSAVPGQRGRARRAQSAAARRSRTRVTSQEVTAEMVQAAIATLGGEATAAQIAAEITRTGLTVSGRAVRFLAEGAGALGVVGENGRRRYRGGAPNPPPPPGESAATEDGAADG